MRIPACVEQSADPVGPREMPSLRAFLTMEYSVQSAALFNRSMVRRPDQGRLTSGDERSIMSVKATG